MGTVLLVEDDDCTREMLCIILRAQNFTVSCHGNGDEALARFCESPPDVVVSDVHMPEMSGIEFVKRIRQLDSVIPIILMTGLPDSDVLQAAIRNRVSEVIVKPFQHSRLIAVIRSVLAYREVLHPL